MSLITAIFIIITQTASGWSELISSAETAYKIGDYSAAIENYEILVQSGLESPALYFNLGASYLESGDAGRGLANLQRAALAWPRDSELNRMINRIRATRVDIFSEESGLLESLSNATSGAFTMNELSIATGLLWAGWFALMGLYLSAVPNKRKTIRHLLLIITVLLVCSVPLLWSRWYIAQARTPAVIIEDQIMVMSGPGQDYLSLYELHAAAEIRIWRTEKDWVQFQLPDGRMGWIPRNTVLLIQTS